MHRAVCWASSSPPPCASWSRRSKHKSQQRRGDIPWMASVSAPAYSTTEEQVGPVCDADVESSKWSVDEEGWLKTLRDARFREGGTLRCDPSARPDGALGVRAVVQYWRRGDVSSYDDDVGGDVLSEAVSSAMASKTSSQNTHHHMSSFLHRKNKISNRGSLATDAEDATAAAAADDDDDAAESHHQHPVLRALLERKRSESKPGARSDGYRIGLAVEGGGMRGVISAGAVGEVLRMGFADCFDVAYGSSAGAMNLTYYLAKQPEGVAAYQEDLVSGEFLDLARFMRARGAGLGSGANSRSGLEPGSGAGAGSGSRTGFAAPVMDVSYLVDGVMDGVTDRGLRWDSIIDSPVPLKVVATSLDTLTPVMLEGPFADVQDLKQCLKASAAVPVFAGAHPVVHRGQRLVDAAVMEPIPVHAAAADGCTHVLVLCTRSLPPPASASASGGEDEGGGLKAGAGPGRSRGLGWGRRRLSGDASEAGRAGRVGVGIVVGSAGSGASALAPALVAACSSRETDEEEAHGGCATDKQSREEEDRRRRARYLFAQVGDFIRRRRGSEDRGRRRRGSGSRDKSVSGGDDSRSSGDVVPAAVVTSARVAEDKGDERRRKKAGKVSKAFNGVLYKTIRGALMNPPHMKDAWGIADATKSLVEDDFSKDLDEALVLARDDPVAAAASGLFPRGISVYAISPLAASMPKGVSSLCVDSEMLAVGSRAGVEATNEVLSRVLACLEREEEVSYFLETMCERDFL